MKRPIWRKGHLGPQRTALLPTAEELNNNFRRVVFREIIDCERGCKSPIPAAE